MSISGLRTGPGPGGRCIAAAGECAGLVEVAEPARSVDTELRAHEARQRRSPSLPGEGYLPRYLPNLPWVLCFSSPTRPLPRRQLVPAGGWDIRGVSPPQTLPLFAGLVAALKSPHLSLPWLHSHSLDFCPTLARQTLDSDIPTSLYVCVRATRWNTSHTHSRLVLSEAVTVTALVSPLPPERVSTLWASSRATGTCQPACLMTCFGQGSNPLSFQPARPRLSVCLSVLQQHQTLTGTHSHVLRPQQGW